MKPEYAELTSMVSNHARYAGDWPGWGDSNACHLSRYSRTGTAEAAPLGLGPLWASPFHLIHCDHLDEVVRRGHSEGDLCTPGEPELGVNGGEIFGSMAANRGWAWAGVEQ